MRAGGLPLAAFFCALLAAPAIGRAQAPPGPPGYPGPGGAGGFRLDDPRLLLPQYEPPAIRNPAQPRLETAPLPPWSPRQGALGEGLRPSPAAPRIGAAPRRSGGFVMSHSLAAPAAGADAPIDRPRDIPARLMACWKRPAGEPDSHLEATLRLAFRADGSLAGPPRVTYVNVAGARRDAIARSFVAAVVACAPLSLTPSLGRAIAGRVFTIRFIAPRPGRVAPI